MRKLTDVAIGIVQLVVDVCTTVISAVNVVLVNARKALEDLKGPSVG